MKKLLKNGYIVDGSGKAGFRGDVLLDGDKISKVAEHIEAERDMEVVDVSKYVVAPGFIDTHSHSDIAVTKEPEVFAKVMQGITTEFTGQDGLGCAPLPKQYTELWKQNLAAFDGTNEKLDWNFPTAKEYLDAVEKARPGINEGYFLPQGNIKMEAMGLDDRKPTQAEIQKMREITEREMKNGCYAISTGMIYLPCLYSTTEELVEICKVGAKYDSVFVTHQRSEANDIVESMKEVIDIGEQSGIKTHWSHFKLCGKCNAHLFDEQIRLFEEARDRGLRVSFDQYPYVAGSTTLGVIMPPWMHDGGNEKLMERLQDKECRARAVHDIKTSFNGWDNFIAFAGLDGIFITSIPSEKNKNLIGKNLEQIGQMRGIDPYEAAMDLLFEEKNAISMYDIYGLEEHVKKFMSMDEQNVCTDGLLVGGKPHPRLYGAFPRVLGKYVREEKALTLEQAIKKMTGKPAEVFGVDRRGLIKEGYYADFCVFDKDTIIDKGTYDNPIQFPDGIIHVIVNGEFAVKDSKHTGTRAGKVLRKGIN